jgi:hypothetical protein
VIFNLAKRLRKDDRVNAFPENINNIAPIKNTSDLALKSVFKSTRKKLNNIKIPPKTAKITDVAILQ